MQWQLYIQICLLIVLVYICATALINSVYEKRMFHQLMIEHQRKEGFPLMREEVRK